MKKNLLIFIFSFLTYAEAVLAQEHGPVFVTITAKNVLLYESPTTSSPVVRRVFVGEILKILETVKNEQNEIWGRAYLSPSQVAYIQGVYLSNSSTAQQELWKPEEVLRNQMPFAFALKGPSELFGPGLQLRYLPFARLGLTLGVGSVLDEGQMKGSSLAFGLVCMLSMGNLSPFIETGSTTLTFNDTHSTLRISTFYVNVGVEWILQSGYFFAVGVSYNKSYDVQVAFDYDYAKTSNGSLALGNYGSFNKVDGKSSLQQLNPLFLVGYSF